MLLQNEKKSDCILAIDLGTSGCKAAVISQNGRLLSWSDREIATTCIGTHGVAQAPQDWWDAFVTSSVNAIKKASIDMRQIVAVCASTQGEATVPVDRSGVALMPALTYRDQRGRSALLKEMKPWIPVAGGYAPTKLFQWLRLTGGAPNLSGKDPAAHMLYIRDEFPAIYEKTYKFLNVLDYINFRLTGRFVATPDSILTSWVTDNRNSHCVRYHPRLIAQSGIDADKFPEIVQCTDVVGQLLPEVADQLGLRHQPPVIAGSIDVSAAALGSGAIVDGDAHLYIGTSSWIAAHVPKKQTDLRTSIASVPCAMPGKYLMIALQTTAGGNLAFLKEQILYHQDELLKESHEPNVYKVLDRIAERVQPGSEGLIYTPWLSGESCPVEGGYLRAGLYNLQLKHSRKHVIRAFLEGVALNTRWMMNKAVEPFLHQKLSSITLIGGGGLSNVWCQIFADILGVRVKQSKFPIEANAMGAAIMAWVGLNRMSFSDAPNFVHIQQSFEPNALHKACYENAYNNYLEIYRRMEPLYRRLHQYS